LRFIQFERARPIIGDKGDDVAAGGGRARIRRIATQPKSTRRLTPAAKSKSNILAARSLNNGGQHSTSGDANQCPRNNVE